MFAAPTAAEADRIIQVTRAYQADRSCFLGRPDPSFTYLLRAGAAPSGALAGEDCITFDPASLVLSADPAGGYVMASGASSMFAFPNVLEAGHALSAIRKHGFVRSSFVGRPGPLLSYLRR